MPYEYKVAGRRIALPIDSTAVAIRFAPDAKKLAKAATVTGVFGSDLFARRFELPSEGITLMPTGFTPFGAGALGPDVLADALGGLGTGGVVHMALPTFRVGRNQVIASDRILAGVSGANRGAVAARYDLELLRSMGDTAVYRVRAGANPFDLSLALSDDPDVRFAEPDFVVAGQHLPDATQLPPGGVPLGPLVPPRYPMEITRAVDAWAIQPGSRDVRIAILDDGVDTSHPDLRDAVVGAYDAVDDDSYQEPNSWDPHGTACAGIAAAQSPIATGMFGSGRGCSLLAVRVAGSDSPISPWRLTTETVVRGIEWSWRNGAAVISNSWKDVAPSNAIIEEFDRARTQGRGGRGCVIVVAAGNDGGPVAFPAIVPGVLAVGATNWYDEAKTKESHDDEKFWASAHGPEVSIAAPGVRVRTTDIAGPAGYDAADYIALFYGTSAAAPLVAGACGLVLSARPNLSEDVVRRILIETADKVGQFEYADGRNDYLGFGRLNVLEAVRLAQGA